MFGCCSQLGTTWGIFFVLGVMLLEVPVVSMCLCATHSQCLAGRLAFFFFIVVPRSGVSLLCWVDGTELILFSVF